MDITNSVKSIVEALLIGTLIGAQREKFPGNHPGLRDMLAIALVGSVCGLLAIPALTGVALGSVALLLAIFHYEHGAERGGITTELAGVATFCLAYLTSATPALPYGAPLAIGSAIVVVMFLEARDWLHKLSRETITDIEFNDTLLFIAVVLVAYPLLPPGHFGPYDFFSPQQVWLFVILVSAISYLGYFLQKFLGTEKGLEYTSLLGGLASTTAATISFARTSREHPERLPTLWRASVIANTVQFPRTMVILYSVSVPIANACIIPLTAMCVSSAALAWYLGRRRPVSPVEAEHDAPQPPGNPFRLLPGIIFGALFAAILFLSKAAAVRFGADAVIPTSILGGLVDVATVILSASDLHVAGKLTEDSAAFNILLALAANIVLKIFLAAGSGTRAFAVRMVIASAITLAAGAAAWLLTHL
ncbi:MAG TPA: MgtC/SapB family protein [Bryobacteraceae bacterium]